MQGVGGINIFGTDLNIQRNIKLQIRISQTTKYIILNNSTKKLKISINKFKKKWSIFYGTRKLFIALFLSYHAYYLNFMIIMLKHDQRLFLLFFTPILYIFFKVITNLVFFLCQTWKLFLFFYILPVFKQFNKDIVPEMFVVMKLNLNWYFKIYPKLFIFRITVFFIWNSEQSGKCIYFKMMYVFNFNFLWIFKRFWVEFLLRFLISRLISSCKLGAIPKTNILKKKKTCKLMNNEVSVFEIYQLSINTPRVIKLSPKFVC